MDSKTARELRLLDRDIEDLERTLAFSEDRIGQLLSRIASTKLKRMKVANRAKLDEIEENDGQS